MNTETKIDLADLMDAIEHLHKTLPKMKLKAKVDVAARLRAVVKTATAIDLEIKDEIEHTLRKDGTLLGEIFKAVLQYVPTTRLVHSKVKADFPDVYEACSETKDVKRITFEAR